MNTSDIFDKMNQDMDKSIDHVMHEFASLHTGKAKTSMVENISVDVYGSAMKLRDIAAITTPDARDVLAGTKSFNILNNELSRYLINLI